MVGVILKKPFKKLTPQLYTWCRNTGVEIIQSRYCVEALQLYWFVVFAGAGTGIENWAWAMPLLKG